MKKKYLMLVISLSLFSLITRAQNTVLSGQLKGLPGAKVNLFYNKDGALKTDTITVVNDVFTWKGNLNEPQQVALSVNNYSNSFFIEPGHIKLTIVKDTIQSYFISGSPTQRDADVFAASLKDLTDEQTELYHTYKNEPTVLKEKLNALEEKRTHKAYQFIAAHPGSFYSLSLLARLSSSDNAYNEVKTLYNKLDKSVKQTESGKKLAGKLTQLAKSRVGMPMADFTQADTSGTPVNFGRFKGKYVLVDFWASWCGPCRAENPNVLKAYNAYKDKGFTVVGISLDDKAANWKKAIRDDKMPWTQLSDLKGWKNKVAVDHCIEAVPSNLLIDPTGKIIAKDLRGEALENKLKELFN